jgi:hypothetical protein
MTSFENENQVTDEQDLVQRIQSSKNNEQVISTVLKTDERVIARVTDGIYRQPGSALRELITNAYDADATRVVIKTDAPRFERISVEDNGLGMTPEALAHMLFHIGGSAKRQYVGQELGIANSENPLYSPSGRKLIGKIGIGIFSVAQLTHTFQIITKTKGDNHRTIATVALKQYSDDIIDTDGKKQEQYESGKVKIWREKAKDIDAHGTTIVLTNIRPQARDTLRSKDIWSTIEQSHHTNPNDEHQDIEPPKFHIGRVDSTGNLLAKSKGQFSNIPWALSDSPDEAFKKLVNCVWDELLESNPNPRLDKLFDYYLQMVWQLSLSIPLPYVEGHLFDLDLSGWADGFKISNEPKGSAEHIKLVKGQPIRNILDLKEGQDKDKFEVLFDDLLLSRPIKFQNLPMSGHAVKNPLVFFGKCREEFKKFSQELSGGPLEFEAYLFWTPKIAPTEHRGSLIRINGASGTGFDPSFMRYQVSEQTRLRQITCEIFIRQGLDSALNIDRESFNYAHPHAVYLTRWLHSALRQLATAQKRIASEIRNTSRGTIKEQALSNLQNIAIKTWKTENKDEDSLPPSITIDDSPVQQPKLIGDADITFNRSAITPKESKLGKAQKQIIDEKIKAIAQILASFGLLDNLSKNKQERLLKAIYQILETSE